MTADELLANNLRYDLPYVDYYDNRYAEADINFLESISSKDSFAAYELADRFYSGTKGANKDLYKSFECYQKVLYNQRNPVAMCFLGFLCMALSEYKGDTLKYFDTAYSLGYQRAALILGQFYLGTWDAASTDYEKAYRYLRQAVEWGLPKAGGYLGQAADHLGRYDEAKALYESALINGETEYAKYLGYLYLVGNGAETDLIEARTYYYNAYQHEKSGYTALMLGFILSLGSDPDKYQAYHYLLEAFDKGRKDAGLFLGILLYKGIPGRLNSDYEAAVRYYKEAVSCDYGKNWGQFTGQAYYWIAEDYYLNHNNEEFIRFLIESAKYDCSLAIDHIYRDERILVRYSITSDFPIVTEYNDKNDKSDISAVLSASDTDPVAMYELAARYRLGEQGVMQDNSKALEYYKKVLLHQRNADAFYWVGRLIRESDPSKEALSLEYFQAGYSLGSVRCAMDIGLAYETGAAGYKTDLNKALGYYLYAKNHGHEFADASIGGIYEKLGNIDLAKRYYEYGILQGDSFAMFDMATYMLNHGQEEEGLRLMQKSAELGNEFAQKVMTDAMERDIPPVQDLIKAIDNAWKAYSPEKGLDEIANLVLTGRKYYPDDPDILIRLITLRNLASYADVVKNQEQEAYESFSNTLKIIQTLKKTAPSRLTKQIEKEESFCCTHLASIALHRDEDSFADRLLLSADRIMTPYSAVVKLEYLLKQENEVSSFNQLPQSHYHQLKSEVEILKKTVESPSNWNRTVERYLGYTMLEIIYRSNAYAPYVKQNQAYALACHNKAEQIKTW